MGHNIIRSTRLRRRLAGAIVIVAAVLFSLIGVLVGGTQSQSRADALCDQMRDRYGSNWPCINVPTYTPQPTQNTPPPTTSNDDGSGGGPIVGGNPGPGPGTGNATPIVPVPGQPTATRSPDAQTQPPASPRPAPTAVPHATSVVPRIPETSKIAPPSAPPEPASPAPVPKIPRVHRAPTGNTDAIPLWVWAVVAITAATVGAMSIGRRTAAAVRPSVPTDPDGQSNPNFGQPDPQEIPAQPLPDSERPITVDPSPPSNDGGQGDGAGSGGADGWLPQDDGSIGNSGGESGTSLGLGNPGPATPMKWPQSGDGQTAPGFDKGPSPERTILEGILAILAAIIAAIIWIFVKIWEALRAFLRWLKGNYEEIWRILSPLFPRAPEDVPPRESPPETPQTPAYPSDPPDEQTPNLPGGEQPGGQPGGEEPGTGQQPGTGQEPDAPELIPPTNTDPETPPELPSQRPPADHRTDPVHPDDPPFGVPETPDGPTPIPDVWDVDFPTNLWEFGRMLEDWLRDILDSGPEDGSPDGPGSQAPPLPGATPLPDPDFVPQPDPQWPDSPDFPFPIVNKWGEPYPEVVDPRTGKPIPFPDYILPIDPKLRIARGKYRQLFIEEWLRRGYPIPPTTGKPFDGWEIHHIIPVEYGGTNDFSNLVPLPVDIHRLFTEWWRNFDKRR